jgi:CDP-glycerol glycerophosphotransferase (TagB/SpsB family)
VGTSTVAKSLRPVPPAAPSLVAYLRAARWVGSVLELQGWAYQAGWPDDAQLRIVAKASGGRSAEFHVTRDHSEVVNTVSADAACDHSSAAFTARLDARDLLRSERLDATFLREWSVRVVLVRGDSSDESAFNRRFRWGSAGQLDAQDVDGCLVRPTWESSRGLTLTAARRAVSAVQVEVTDSSAALRLHIVGSFQPEGAVLQGDRDEERSAVLTPLDGATYAVRVDAATLLATSSSSRPPPSSGAAPVRRRWYLALVDSRGVARKVHWSGDGARGRSEVFPTHPECSIRNAPSGVVRLDVGPPRVWIDQVDVDGGALPTLAVSGRHEGSNVEAETLTLQSGRVVVTANEMVVSDDGFTARFPLRHQERWSAEERPLRSDAYRLVTSSGTSAEPSRGLLDQLPQNFATAEHQLQLETDRAGRLHVRVAAPRPLTETGAYPRRRLREDYRRLRSVPANAAYFESWVGKSAYDQTRAVHDEVLRRRPDLTRYWGVADSAVEVPDGTVPVLIHTAEWWRVLATSRLLVTNCWMSGAFRRRSYQRVQQTWHGTPYKAMGLDRIGRGERPGYATKIKREVGQWSQLIVQNQYSAEIFAAAYGFENQVLEIGYPRNDVLARPVEAARLADLRTLLGLRPGELVILYLPTWREDDKIVYRGLGFDRLLNALGGNARLLVRGHTNTVRHDSTLEHAGLIDVTLYPDVNDLYLASDVLITDYSSAMFDYSVTGKPLIFFAPDLDHYTGELRGAYFSLPDLAPGPVLQTTDQVIDALRDLPEVNSSYAARYDAWRAMFNYLDDGHAAERAADALLTDLP